MLLLLRVLARRRPRPSGARSLRSGCHPVGDDASTSCRPTAGTCTRPEPSWSAQRRLDRRHQAGDAELLDARFSSRSRCSRPQRTCSPVIDLALAELAPARCGSPRRSRMPSIDAARVIDRAERDLVLERCPCPCRRRSSGCPASPGSRVPGRDEARRDVALGRVAGRDRRPPRRRPTRRRGSCRAGSRSRPRP